MSEPQILISAGEASSDMYAARLAIALRARVPAKFFGMGGPRMAEAGVELVADYHEVAVVGITEVLHKIPAVVSVQNRLAREAAKRRRRARHPRGFARDASRGGSSPEACQHSSRLFHRPAGVGLACRPCASSQAPGTAHGRDISV